MRSAMTKAVTDVARGVVVMCRAGLVPLRLDHGVRSLLAVRTWGAVAGAIHAAVFRAPHAVAITDEKGSLTYAQLDAQSTALARAWSRSGLRSGSVIAALCRNHRGLVITMAAAGKLGARLLLMNTGFGAPQLADVANRESAAAIVYDEEFSGVVDALPETLTRYLAWADDARADTSIATIEDLIAGSDGAPLPAPASQGGLVLLTSGTTGTPKGAPRPRISALDSAQFLDRIPLRAGDTIYLAAPLFHATGLSQFILSTALRSNVVMRRHFDPHQALRTISEHRCTALVLVPTMLQRILDLGPEEIAAYDTSSLRLILVSGSALSADLGNRAMNAFGEILHNLYGSTEVAVGTVATPQDWRLGPGTVGRPPAGCTVALFDSAGKPITKPSSTGRVFVGSRLSFQGYSDGSSKETIDHLLATGDLGHFDDHGLLFIDGREDDMIISGGENVFPGEIEDLLTKRDDIAEAAVVGVEDPEYGQRLKAFIVLAPSAQLDADGVRSYVKSHLARHKVPRDVEFLPELPRNATGKLVRRKLVERQ